LDEIKWFIHVLISQFDVKVDENQISYEGNELHLDEIDDSLVPSELTKDLPDTLFFETMKIDDKDRTEWLGIIALHPETYEWYLQVILKDGEPVLRLLENIIPS
jgi:hypothetical protein